MEVKAVLVLALLFCAVPATLTMSEEECGYAKAGIIGTCDVAESVASSIPVIGGILGAAGTLCSSLTGNLMDCENLSARLAEMQKDVTEILETVTRIDEAIGDLKETVELGFFETQNNYIDFIQAIRHAQNEYNDIVKKADNGVIAKNSQTEEWARNTLHGHYSLKHALEIVMDMVLGPDYLISENPEVYRIAKEYGKCTFGLYEYINSLIVQATALTHIALAMTPDLEVHEVDKERFIDRVDLNLYTYQRICKWTPAKQYDGKWPPKTFDFDMKKKPLQIKRATREMRAEDPHWELQLDIFDKDEKWLGKLGVSLDHPSGYVTYGLEHCTNGFMNPSYNVKASDLPTDPLDRTWTVQITDTTFYISCNDKLIVQKELTNGRCKNTWSGGRAQKVEVERPWTAMPMLYNEYAAKETLHDYTRHPWIMHYINWNEVVRGQTINWPFDSKPLSVKTTSPIGSGKKVHIKFDLEDWPHWLSKDHGVEIRLTKVPQYRIGLCVGWTNFPANKIPQSSENVWVIKLSIDKTSLTISCNRDEVIDFNLASSSQHLCQEFWGVKRKDWGKGTDMKSISFQTTDTASTLMKYDYTGDFADVYKEHRNAFTEDTW